MRSRTIWRLLLDTSERSSPESRNATRVEEGATGWKVPGSANSVKFGEDPNVHSRDGRPADMARRAANDRRLAHVQHIMEVGG